MSSIAKAEIPDNLSVHFDKDSVYIYLNGGISVQVHAKGKNLITIYTTKNHQNKIITRKEVS